MKKIVLFTLMFINILIISCKTKNVNKAKILLNKIEIKFEISLFDYKYICIINDGGCLPCNRKCSNALTDASKSNDFLIIIAENGSVLDLRAFEYDAPNIYHTYDDISGESQIKADNYFGELDNSKCASLEYIGHERSERIITKTQQILDKIAYNLTIFR